MATRPTFSGLIGCLRKSAPQAGRCQFEGSVDASFGQGRTTFGGAGAAVAFAAARQTVIANGSTQAAPPPPLRSLLVSFCGPIAPGDFECRTEVLRAGKNITSCESKIYQKGCRLSLVASLGAHIKTSARVETESASAAGIELPDMARIPSMPRPSKESPAAAFLGHFEIKFHEGVPFPVDVPKGRRTAVWLRHRDLDFFRSDPAAALIAMADMPPPVIMLHYDTPIAASSVTWFLEFVVDPADVAAASPDGWLFLDYRLDSAANGYSQQSGRIFDASGRLVAYSRQSMAYYDPKL